MGLRRDVRDRQDEQLAAIDTSGTASRLLSAGGENEAPRSRARWWSLAAAAIVGSLLLILWPRALTLTIDGHPAAEGEWVAAPANGSRALQFSDGSVFELGSQARMRIGNVTEHGAELSVERGRVDADVVPQEGGRWVLSLGPYGITVLGTQFAAHWHPEDKRLIVKMFSGSVSVEGPNLPPHGIALNSGRRLVVDSHAVAIDAAALDAEVVSLDETPAVDPRPALPAPTTSSTGGPSVVPSATAKPSASATSPPQWRTLAETGEFAKAFQAAERSGFDSLLDRTDAAGLALLTDTARYANRPAKARAALLATRRRFRGQPAAQAAFLLGRMSFASQPAEAAKWFSIYLGEAPSGTLAREAAGRLIEARQAAGDSHGATEAAAQYLKRHPKGPHAAMAQRLVEAREP